MKKILVCKSALIRLLVVELNLCYCNIHSYCISEAVLRKEKRFMVLIGYDKKACFVDTECSKTFPKREGILSIEERYNLRTNDELYIYWNNGKVREQIKAVFKSFGKKLRI